MEDGKMSRNNGCPTKVRKTMIGLASLFWTLKRPPWCYRKWAITRHPICSFYIVTGNVQFNKQLTALRKDCQIVNWAVFLLLLRSAPQAGLEPRQKVAFWQHTIGSTIFVLCYYLLLYHLRYESWYILSVRTGYLKRLLKNPLLRFRRLYRSMYWIWRLFKAPRLYFLTWAIASCPCVR